MAKKFPIHPKNPERICWGCDKYCKGSDLQCGNGCERIQHPMELDGADWYKNGDWSNLLSEAQQIELGLKSASETKPKKPHIKLPLTSKKNHLKHTMQLIDSHCHLNFEGLAGRLPEVLANMADNQVKQALAISVSKKSFAEILAIAEQHPQIYATVGIHPDDPDTEEFTLAELLEHARHPKVVGIGETGLDYHWCKGDLAWQHRRFAEHIEAANQSRLPLIVHTRDAADDTMSMLKTHQAHAGVIHCFTEDVRVAKLALDLGFYISFSGIVTFKNAPLIQEAARYTPLDRILVETDAPFLAPVPKRGKPNEPAYVRHTAEFLAQLRGDTLENIATATTANFYRLFDKVPKFNEAH